MSDKDKIYVLKRNGLLEEFRPEKIRRTILKAGFDEKTANLVLKELENEIYNGIKTDEILEIVLDKLENYRGHGGRRYDLKRAVYRLGPSGFKFEKLFARILQEYGYMTRTNVILQGRCVEHEIDIVAEKDGRKIMIECKFHNLDIYTGLKEAMYTYARSLDVEKFDEVWIVTNTKFSSEALRYAECMGIKLIGWNYPEGKGIESLIESKKLYPVTLIKTDRKTIELLVNSGIVFCNDVLEAGLEGLKKLGLGKRKAEQILHGANHILSKE